MDGELRFRQLKPRHAEAEELVEASTVLLQHAMTTTGNAIAMTSFLEGTAVQMKRVALSLDPDLAEEKWDAMLADAKAKMPELVRMATEEEFNAIKDEPREEPPTPEEIKTGLEDAKLVFDRIMPLLAMMLHMGMSGSVPNAVTAGASCYLTSRLKSEAVERGISPEEWEENLEKTAAFVGEEIERRGAELMKEATAPMVKGGEC